MKWQLWYGNFFGSDANGAAYSISIEQIISNIDNIFTMPPDFRFAWGPASLTGGASVSGAVVAPAPRLITSPGSGLGINLVWDASVASAPAGFMQAVEAAALMITKVVTNAMTLNIAVGWGEVGGYAGGSSSKVTSGSAVGGTGGDVSESYATLVRQLTASATSADDRAMLATLPAANPFGTLTYDVAGAQLKAFGLVSGTATAIDGEIGFATDWPAADFIAAALHEMTHAMGRNSGWGSAANGNDITPLDLTRYSAPGVLADNGAAATNAALQYFSLDGGRTVLADYSSASDYGDWATTALTSNDPMDAYLPSNSNALTAVDVRQLDVMGYSVAASTTPAPTPAPTPSGVAVVAVATAGLGGLLTGTGLAGGKALATVQQVGGRAGDAFSYAVTGAGAAGFSVNGAGVLSTASAGLAGATGGKLYALGLTATDTTAAGSASAATPINVVVGSGAGETVTLAHLTGLTAAAPIFVFGGSGKDTITGSGVTGTIYFDGAGGGDVLTGGSGTNMYEFGAASQSTATLMTVINNFVASRDFLDFTGIGTKMVNVVALAANATKIGADSVGWQASGGNTYVYVNTAGGTEALTGANMKIELVGAITLTSSNILHA